MRNFSFRRNKKYKTFFSKFFNFSVSFFEIISNLNDKGFYDRIKVNNKVEGQSSEPKIL